LELQRVSVQLRRDLAIRPGDQGDDSAKGRDDAESRYLRLPESGLA